LSINFREKEAKLNEREETIRRNDSELNESIANAEKKWIDIERASEDLELRRIDMESKEKELKNVQVDLEEEMKKLENFDRAESTHREENENLNEQLFELEITNQDLVSKVKVAETKRLTLEESISKLREGRLEIQRKNHDVSYRTLFNSLVLARYYTL